MRIILRLAGGNEELDLKLPEDQIVQARPRKVPPSKPIEELASEALRDPAYAHCLRDEDLEDKRVVVMVDDKYRPTPTSKVVPPLLEELEMLARLQKHIELASNADF